MLFSMTDSLMGLAGGLLIGLSATLFLLANGRIAGISGIAGDMLSWNSLSRGGENLAFVIGLPLGAALFALWFGAPAIGLDASLPVVLAGGLLVGFGTRLGAGCTSGHGVCGLSRLSRRSFAATGLFMATAVLTVTLVRLMAGPAL